MIKDIKADEKVNGLEKPLCQKDSDVEVAKTYIPAYKLQSYQLLLPYNMPQTFPCLLQYCLL